MVLITSSSNQRWFSLQAPKTQDLYEHLANSDKLINMPSVVCSIGQIADEITPPEAAPAEDEIPAFTHWRMKVFMGQKAKVSIQKTIQDWRIILVEPRENRDTERRML